ncbi:MAG: GntR family transcriptional regulator [Acidobacteria bacterium]|nr:GntR family transcriptional regulator [Acidobacteriota bacterium]
MKERLPRQPGRAATASAADSRPRVEAGPAAVDGDVAEPGVLRGVLSEQIKDVILRWIVEGRLPLGSRIVETRVARTLGTSQAPVREALRDLETLGVVEIEAFRGARVRQPSSRELLEAFSVRAEIEALASREATPRITDASLRAMEESMALMREAAAVDDVHAHALANAQFHAAIVKAADNKTLTRVWGVLEPFARTYITATLASAASTNLAHLADRHDAILEAIRAGDADKAAEVTRAHLLDAREILRRGLEVSDQPSAISHT